MSLRDEFIIDSSITLPIVGWRTTRKLKQEGIIPCTYGELKYFDGSLLQQLVYVLANTEHVNGSDTELIYRRDDYFTCLWPITKTTPHCIEWTIDKCKSVKVVKHTQCRMETQHIEHTNGEFILLYKDIVHFDDTYEKRYYQYKYHSSVPYAIYSKLSNRNIVYYTKLNTFEGELNCVIGVTAVAWDKTFPIDRHNIYWDDVEKAFSWGDILNKKRLRKSSHPDSNLDYFTLHCASVSDEISNGKVLASALYKDNQLMLLSRHGFVPSAHSYSGEDIKPTSTWFDYNTNGLLTRKIAGGKYTFSYKREYDENGLLLSITECKEHEHSEQVWFKRNSTQSRRNRPYKCL